MSRSAVRVPQAQRLLYTSGRSLARDYLLSVSALSSAEHPILCSPRGDGELRWEAAPSNVRSELNLRPRGITARLHHASVLALPLNLGPKLSSFRNGSRFQVPP